MDSLPVPALAQTLERYLGAVAPLLSPREQLQAEDAVRQTLDGRGPACQADLEAFAASEAAAGRSWLSTEWLRGYLDVRTALPLTSSVGFQIRVPGLTTDPDDPARPDGRTGSPAARSAAAAEVVQRLAGVHLAWLRGELPAEETPRGEQVCGQQRAVLAGGLRHPGGSTDEFRPADHTPRGREIGLLVDDRLMVAPISNEHGQPLSRLSIARAIEAALKRATASGPSTDPGFTALSYLGSGQACTYLDRLLADPDNQRVYDRLGGVLFVVNLVRTRMTMEDHLWRTAFWAGRAWAYTPITYQVSLVDDFVGMHLEHSQVDAATLKAVLAHAQSDAVTGRAGEEQHGEPGQGGEPALPVEALEWSYPDDLAERLATEVAAYRAKARQIRLDTVRVPRPVPPDLLFRVSDDALCQWVMLYAQLATYGHVRSTYEAVDTRHYQAGRTECLRAVTPEAVRLVRALLDGDAEGTHLDEALAAHKDWIKACKTGQGIDRHLTGLAMVAKARQWALPVLDDPSYQRLKTDFLSTSSIGDHDQIVGMCFAPTSGGGIGINYTALPERYEFLVTSHRTQTGEVQTFLARLAEAAEALAALLHAIPHEPQAQS
ncbi:MAG: choline/carnitine O-acyltransferase [Ornithinimicrobium sp.]